MPRFFLSDINTDRLLITGDDARHLIKSLRHTVGDTVTVCDGQGHQRNCVIEAVNPDGAAALTGGEVLFSHAEDPFALHLYMGFPKGDKAERVIKAAVELGARDITFFLSEFTVARPDERTQATKLVRFQRIADEAAKQSGRAILPAVRPFLKNFAAVLSDCTRAKRMVLFYEHGGGPLEAALQGHPESAALIIGSEGGFSEKEALSAEAAGVILCTLGSRILRCETAPTAALALAGHILS